MTYIIGIWGSMPKTVALIEEKFRVNIHDRHALYQENSPYSTLKFCDLRVDTVNSEKGWVVTGLKTISDIEELIEAGGILFVPNNDAFITRENYLKNTDSVLHGVRCNTPWVADIFCLDTVTGLGEENGKSVDQLHIDRVIREIQLRTILIRNPETVSIERELKEATSEEMATWQDIEKDPLEIPGMDELDAEVRNGLASHAPPEYD